MKKISILFVLFVTMALASCGSNNDKNVGDTTLTANDDADKIGEFSFDGTSVKGKVSTQYFGSDKVTSNFSVLCQYDEEEPKDRMNPDFVLLQITFVNEKDATTNPNLKLYHGVMLPMTDPETGNVTVSISGSSSHFQSHVLSGTSKSTGTIKVSGREIIITGLTLFPLKEFGDKAVTVNAKIPF